MGNQMLLHRQATRGGGRGTPARRRPAGFTLIEMLLVAFIAALLASLAMPAFVRAFRGAQLRTAVRSAVMVHRHARNLAIIRQRHVAVRVDQEQNLFDVVVLPPQAGNDQEDLEDWLQSGWKEDDAQPADEQPAAPLGAAAQYGGGPATNGPATMTVAPAKLELEARRDLPASVHIAAVENNRQNPGGAGPVWLFYYPSGLCDSYVLQLQDDHGRTAELTADPLTGQVSVEYLNENAGPIEDASAARREGPWTAAGRG